MASRTGCKPSTSREPELSGSAGNAGLADFLEDGSGGRARIGGVAHGPAHDEQARARANGLARSAGALLVVSTASSRANTGRHQHDRWSELPAQGINLSR